MPLSTLRLLPRRLPRTPPVLPRPFSTAAPVTPPHPPALKLDLPAAGLIESHRHRLAALLASVQACGEARQRDVALLEAEIARLGDAMFMLVVTGEYNSGKSSLINALVGRRVVAEGRTPTTDRVIKVLWQGVQVVDTPGTNAVLRRHEVVTKEFVPLCDLVLFVTSAERPFSESERLFLQSIRDWGKKVILVLNKMDLVEDEEERHHVIQFVKDAAKGLLGEDVKVFAVSAKAPKNHEQTPKSGLQLLEQYVTDTLDDAEKLRLKLNACAAVGETIGKQYLQLLDAHRCVLEKDRATLDYIDSLLTRHEDTVRKSAVGHFARADNVLLQTLDRADLFFDMHVRLTNVWTLSKRETVKNLFQQQVVNGIATGVQREIRAAADWLADLSSRNLTETTAVFSKRLGERAQEISHTSSLAFSPREMDARTGGERLVTRFAQASEELATEYVSGREGQRVAEQLASAVRLSTGLGVGAVGTFGAFALNSASVSADVLLADPTMPVLSGVLGALAVAAVPRQKAALRAELRARVMSVRTILQKELEVRMEELLTAHGTGVKEATEGFREFVEKKERDVEVGMEQIEKAVEEVERLESRMEEVDKR